MKSLKKFLLFLFKMYTVEDFIYDLALQNQEEMVYNEFKGKIQRKFPNIWYDGDEIGEFYKEYKQQRQKESQIATKFLKGLIDENKTGVVKDTVGKLFQLASFRDRRELVDENEIWNYYLRHNKQKEAKPLLKPKPPEPPKPPKPKLDLAQAKALIYDNLIRSGTEFINENEFMN